MSVFEYERDAIRVRARFNSPKEEVLRKFSVDPNLTSYEILRNLLSRAFDLNQDDFRLHYQYTEDQWFPLLSDWDLDAAIISASDPCLNLELVAYKPSTSSEPESEVSSPVLTTEDQKVSPGAIETIQSLVNHSNQKSVNFFNQTIPALTKKIHKALSMPDESQPSPKSSPDKTLRPPVSDKEFRGFLDNVGQLVRPKELRLAIYQGGIEVQLRKVVWKHLLGVYPYGMNGKERLDYMKQKSAEYEAMKADWTSLVVGGKIKSCTSQSAENLKNITNMVRKDVLRTDRHHPFYAGEGNTNVTALFNILTTFALNHPSVGYCQVITSSFTKKISGLTLTTN